MQTLLGIWAHPDDEAYLSAGLMGRVADGRGRVVCVHATDGERGTDDPVRWPPHRLAPIRRRELRASLAVLGVTASRRLGLPDGGLATCEDRRVTHALARMILSVRPDVIVTFGPDGMTGHPDHATISRWVTAAWNTTGRGADLLYATTSPAAVERHRAIYAELDVVPDRALPHTTPEDELALEVALDGWELDRKRAALAAHASQTVPLVEQIGEERYRAWLDREFFRRPTTAELMTTATNTQKQGASPCP